MEKSQKRKKEIKKLAKNLERQINGSKKTNKSPLSSFHIAPKKVKFIGADSQEEVVLLLRKHPMTNLRWIVMSFILVLLPLALSFIDVVAKVPVDLQLVVLMVWYLVVIAFIFEEFLSWYFNVYIVTDERVFDVDFVNLVYREITDANLDQIQDVTVRVSGTLRTFLNYGDILIQTASETPQIEFESVPRPDDVAQVLRELRVQEEIEKLEGRVR